jgi:glycosyltransferase involved in cell wall biosynthesis
MTLVGGPDTVRAVPDQEPLLVLLLPRTLEQFILRDQAEDLLKHARVVAVEPAKVPYGALGRLPKPLRNRLAYGQARRLKLPGVPRAVAIFHPFQYPLARALIERYPGCELWYGRWDRYEEALDASERDRERLRELHELAAERSELTFVASDALARLETDAGREAVSVGLAADSFPAPGVEGVTVAFSLGHLGHRVDWALLRAVCEGMGDGLVLLLIGEWHADELRGDDDFAAVRAAPNVVWLGRRSDEEASRLILTADVGIVPFREHPFNEAGLPYRILKAARLGRRSVVPSHLSGARTWGDAVVVANGVDEWVEELRAAAGARLRPDASLREWALAQTAYTANAPLRARMRELGID